MREEDRSRVSAANKSSLDTIGYRGRMLDSRSSVSRKMKFVLR